MDDKQQKYDPNLKLLKLKVSKELIHRYLVVVRKRKWK